MVRVSWPCEKLEETPRQSVLGGRHGTDVLFQCQINPPPTVGSPHQITQNNLKGVNKVNVSNAIPPAGGGGWGGGAFDAHAKFD